MGAYFLGYGNRSNFRGPFVGSLMPLGYRNSIRIYILAKYCSYNLGGYRWTGVALIGARRGRLGVPPTKRTVTTDLNRAQFLNEETYIRIAIAKKSESAGPGFAFNRNFARS